MDFKKYLKNVEKLKYINIYIHSSTNIFTLMYPQNEIFSAKFDIKKTIGCKYTNAYILTN